MKKIPISIKLFIRLSLFFAVFIIFLVSFLYYTGIYKYYSMQHLNNSHDRLTNKINSQLEELLISSDDALKRVLYAVGAQTMIFAHNPIEYIQNKPSAVSFLDNAIKTKSFIKDIYVYCEGGYEFYSTTDWQTRKRYIKMIQEEIIDANNIKPRYFTTAGNEGGNIDKPAVELFYYTPMYNTRFYIVPEHKFAHCIVACDVDILTDILSTGLYENETIALIYGTDIITNSEYLSNEFTESILSLNYSDSFSGATTINNQDYMYNRFLLTSLGEWSVAYFVPVDSVLGHFYYLRNVSILVLLLSLIALTIFQEIIIRIIYSHIQVLSEDIKNVRNNTKLNVDMPYLVDLRSVADGFNRTISEMRDFQEREKKVAHELYQTTLARQMATINAYKYQIQPHFLFNIMETMRSMAHCYHNNDLEQLIKSTSAFLRYTLRENILIPVEKELEFIKVYYDIMEIRYPGRFILKIKATDDSLICVILTAVLQPLVENCITHAFIPGKNTLTISIKASTVYKDNKKYLIVLVVDNGNGISDETMKKLEKYMLQKSTEDSRIHVGLNNVYHRMLLYFGNNFSMKVRTKHHFYTCIKMKIPQDTPYIGKTNNST